MKQLLRSTLLAALASFAFFEVAVAQVARVLRIDGAAMVDHVGQPRRLLGVGEQLQERAVVTVAKESFVMLEFRDQTRVTLRPNTVFRVEAYVDDSPESVTFGLAKGGLRAVSGLIGQRKPESVRVNTSSAWIGIRGTEFDARLCEEDCAAEERAASSAAPMRSGVAARVLEMQGTVVAVGSALPTRVLAPGAVIYERDSIATAADAWIVVSFTDETRASIGPSSVVGVEHYRFAPERTQKHQAHLRLFEGDLRLALGPSAARASEAYRVETALAPVAVRGPTLDIFCSGSCAAPHATARSELNRMKAQADRMIERANADAGVKNQIVAISQIVPPKPPAQGLLVHPVDGIALVGSGSGRSEVPAGTTAIVVEPGGAPKSAGQSLTFFARNTTPRPDKITVDKSIFGQEREKTYEPGLYVWVRDGAIMLNPLDQRAQQGGRVHVAAAGALNELGNVLKTGSGPVVVEAGQAAVITKTDVVLLPAVPNFMRLDTTPLPTRANVPVNLPFFKGRDGSTVGLCNAP